MGRKPEGEQPLTGAERQARYRARLAEVAAPVPPAPPPRPRHLTRIERWDAHTGGLVALQAEYADWLDAMPPATRDSPTGQLLQAIVDLDLDELLAIQLPRGFGRD
jgi:hypothetical protein